MEKLRGGIVDGEERRRKTDVPSLDLEKAEGRLREGELYRG
jgi:hypothetical protein